MSVGALRGQRTGDADGAPGEMAGTANLPATGRLRLLVLSDLHMEHWHFDSLDASIFDIAVLAGDIWSGFKAIDCASERSTFGGTPVAYVPGNHELYGPERIEMLSQIRETAAGSNVHVIDCDQVVIPDVQFLGATLWNDFRLYVAKGVDAGLAMQDAKYWLNDFTGFIRQRVRLLSGTPSFTAYQFAQEHAKSKPWLGARLSRSRTTCTLKASLDDASNISTVVVAHHAPSGRSVHLRVTGSRLNPCSELSPLFFQTADLWIHDHVYNSLNYQHYRTRVIANPRGYMRRDSSMENADFESDLVVDVPLVTHPGCAPDSNPLRG